ncbi:unnamed protein product [Owenia fusiformis]|uniref:Uncharacterized protein n=1 Tax=Owenia fusiformis TaxID=6347 RepID=A0A8J1TQU0_OWEFU|nr:unnamed protein product [Owenia fusiformis]
MLVQIGFYLLAWVGQAAPSSHFSTGLLLQKIVSGQSLNGYTLQSVWVESLAKCSILCSANEACHSINYEVGAPSIGQCDIIMCSTDSNDPNLVTNTGFSYFGKIPIGSAPVCGPCTSAPCHNGGDCITGVSATDFTCSCVPGFTGATCEQNIDECASSPCLNGGTCNDLNNQYECDCQPGYTGSDCETDINECSSIPCMNGQACVDLVNGFSCNCTGFTGTLCEADIDECLTSNGGCSDTCTNSFGSYVCSCPPEKYLHADGLTCCLPFWPSGFYGLPRVGPLNESIPLDGCPTIGSEGFVWSTGDRYFDTENTFSSNSWTTGIHFPLTYGKDDIRLHFCMKTTDYAAICVPNTWPTGSYCLYRASGQACPTGFEDGWLKWDDENIFNSNSFSGELPYGIYDHNTKIHFCCRDDDSVSTPIHLPTDQPFYMFPKTTGACQAVMGMTSILELFHFDCEDYLIAANSLVDTGGNTPYLSTSGVNVDLYICYYYK